LHGLEIYQIILKNSEFFFSKNKDITSIVGLPTNLIVYILHRLRVTTDVVSPFDGILR